MDADVMNPGRDEGAASPRLCTPPCFVQRVPMGGGIDGTRPSSTAARPCPLQCSDLTPIFIGMHRNAPLSSMEEGARVHHSYGSYAPFTYGSYEPRRANPSTGQGGRAGELHKACGQRRWARPRAETVRELREIQRLPTHHAYGHASSSGLPCVPEAGSLWQGFLLDES